MSSGGPGFCSNDPELLCPCIRDKCQRLMARAKEIGIAVTLLETMRDSTRQEYYVSRGVSKTLKSLHLPQEPNKLALAFDLAPTEYLKLRGWWPEGPKWLRLGIAGEALGLTWGGPGIRDDGFAWDYSHYQISKCQCEVKHDESRDVDS